MITLTRNAAKQIRAVFRRALGITANSRYASSAPCLHFSQAADELVVRAANPRAAVTYCAESDGPDCELTAPIDLLDDCQGTRKEPVTIEAEGDNRIVARWTDGGVPQLVQYDRPTFPFGQAFPVPPEPLSPVGPELLDALREACAVADREPVRYATDCIRLGGKDKILAATDGHHLFVQRGFDFPWENDVLIPANRVLQAKELTGNGRAREPVQVGATEGWFTLVVGQFAIHLPAEQERRFPKIDDLISREPDELASVRFSDSDAEILAKTLKRLPGHDDPHSPVTLDVREGRVLVRAKAISAGESDAPTELVLNGSAAAGDPISLSMNRAYLEQAVRLGLRDLFLYGPEAPVRCHGDRRIYVCMVLSPEAIVKPNPDAVRIESTGTRCQASSATHEPRTNGQTTGSVAAAAQRPPSAATNPSHQPERNTLKMPRQKSSTNTNDNGHQASDSPAENNGVDALIEQAEAIKASLRQTAADMNQLIQSLKQHRKQAKVVQSTLASLRQLESVA